jgi:Alginate export
VTKPLAAGAALSVVTWAVIAGAQTVPPAPPTIAVADWQLTPVFDVRVRGEYRRDLDDQDRALAVERSRLGVDASHGPLEARVVLEDARAVLLTDSLPFVVGPSPMAVTGAYEGWFEVHSASARPSFVRVGRQPITWGEGRLLGVADWSPAGRSLDAVRGRLVFGDGAAELLAAALESPSPPQFSVNAYASLFGGRFEWAFDPLFQIDVYELTRVAYFSPGLPTSGSLQGLTYQGQTYTGALRLHGQGQEWAWGAEGAYQLGHVDDVLRFDPTTFSGPRAAWAAAGHVARTFENVMLSPTLALGGAYASGDERGGTYRAFDPLLPDVHTWHGAMDLFSWSNEIEANLRVAVVPWVDGVAVVEYRYARLAQADDAWRSAYVAEIAHSLRNTSADLGHEVDAMVRWSPWVPLQLEGGYSLFVLGSGARALIVERGPAPQVSHFAYVQTRLSF